jgi:hypothetical protein
MGRNKKATQARVAAFGFVRFLALLLVLDLLLLRAKG